MSNLSGKVAILSLDLTTVIGTRELGPVPIEVKSNVRPLEESKPPLAAGEMYDYQPNYEILSDKVIATYGKIAIPEEPPSLLSRLDELETRIVALEKL